MKDSKQLAKEALEQGYNKSSNTLNLNHCQVKNFQISLILFNHDFSSLRYLYIQGKQLNDDTMLLITSLKLSNLVTINLSNNKITKKGVQYLMRGDLRNLRELVLERNKIGNEGFNEIVHGKGVDLTEISVKQCQINYEGLQSLVEERVNWTHMKYLNLSNNKLGLIGIKYLIKGNWPHLRNLILEKTQLNCECVRLLTKGNMFNLIQLNLNHNKLGYNSTMHFANSKWFNLEMFNLHCARVQVLHLFLANWKNLRNHCCQIVSVNSKTLKNEIKDLLRCKFNIKIN